MQPLADLAHGLQDPEAWIDPTMWAGPAKPFGAAAYLVTVDSEAGPPAFGHYPPAIDDVAGPFQAPITKVGSPHMAGTEVSPGLRCLVVTGDQARAMADAEAMTGRSRDLSAWGADLGYRREPGTFGNVIATTRPLLPYQSGGCADTFAW